MPGMYAKPAMHRRVDDVDFSWAWPLGPIVLAISLNALCVSSVNGQINHRTASSNRVAATLLLDMRPPRPLARAEEEALTPGDMFKECPECPDMIVVPPGKFVMGAAPDEPGSEDGERPQHSVTIVSQFAVGRFEVTFAEWDACVAEGGCRRYVPPDKGWGRGRMPVINIRWDDARAYVKWLSNRTGKTYRLLSEAEREYVTRAGTTTPFWWGSSISTDQANYDGSFSYPPLSGVLTGIFRGKTMPVDAFAPNPWGLYQVHGNVYEWVEDCWHRSYWSAPTDGSPWTNGNCTRNVLRGGAWNSAPWQLRSSARNVIVDAENRIGMRVARVINH